MSARTGLGPVEVSLLDALDLLGSRGEPVRCSDALTVVETRHGIGPRYSWPVLVDLGVPWRLHLPLVELLGNAGTAMGEQPAEPGSVEARLSGYGALALAAERAEVGPIPLGLVEGSLYRGGGVPPFDPDTVIGALLAASNDAGRPTLPTGGTVDGDVDGLLAGRPARLTLGCTIRPEGGNLVITEVPLGVEGNRIVPALESRSQQYRSDAAGAGQHRGRRRDSPVVQVLDETNARDGIRLLCVLDPAADLLHARDWLREVWPVTVDVDCRLPGPMTELMSGWDRGDGTGLRALADLRAPLPPPDPPR